MAKFSHKSIASDSFGFEPLVSLHFIHALQQLLNVELFFLVVNYFFRELFLRYFESMLDQARSLGLFSSPSLVCPLPMNPRAIIKLIELGNINDFINEVFRSVLADRCWKQQGI